MRSIEILFKIYSPNPKTTTSLKSKPLASTEDIIFLKLFKMGYCSLNCFISSLLTGTIIVLNSTFLCNSIFSEKISKSTKTFKCSF